MASATYDPDGGWGRWARLAIPAVILALVGWAVWIFAHQEAGVTREEARVSTLIPVQEPPPPPPPQVKPPEPKPVETPVPQPTPQPPQPQPQAQPQPSQPTTGQNAVTENGPAQAGSDAFNIGAGSGGGGRGQGGAGGFVETAGIYGQYARGPMTQAIHADELLRGKSFAAEARLWFDAAGRITRVEVTRGSGTAAYDAEIRRVLLALRGLRAPSSTALGQMPIRFSIDERSAS